MRTLEEVKNNCQSKMSNKIQLFDNLIRRRRWYATTALVMTNIIVFYLVLGFVEILAQESHVDIHLGFLFIPEVILAAIVAVFLTIYLMGLASARRRMIKKYYKGEIIEQLIHCIDETITYSSGRFVEQWKYQDSQFCLGTIRGYTGEDYFSGKIGDTEWEFSEIQADIEEVYDAEKTVKLIQRLFFNVYFKKKVNGKVLVCPNYGVFDKYLAAVSVERGIGKSLPMENVEFNKMFSVYSADKILAYYVVTPKLMEAIIRLKKVIKGDIALSFIQSHMYMSVSKLRNLFEYDTNQRLLDSDVFMELYEVIYFIHTMVEEMGLNNRIWTLEFKPENQEEQGDAV